MGSLRNINTVQWVLRAPRAVLVGGVSVLVVGWFLATGLRIQSNFVELLPSESPAAQRFHAAVERAAGAGSSLMVLVQSPDPTVNQAFIDAVERKVQALPAAWVSRVEHGPENVAAFVDRYRWLLADSNDLRRVECELAAARARAVPGYVELEDPCSDFGTDALRQQLEKTPVSSKAPLSTLRQVQEQQAEQLNRFPSGYYRTADGTTYALIVRAAENGLADATREALLNATTDIVERQKQKPGNAKLEVGLAGEIPNTVAEHRALQDDLTRVTAIAVGLVLLSILAFFSFDVSAGGAWWRRFGWRRGVLSLGVIGFCVTTGCAVAFGLARLRYGHLNAATTFLGSVIIGNGINYAIVYLARYHEQRAVGLDVRAALIDAERACFRATGLSALSAGGAYGALMATSFRGFSEFGLIGAVGMLSCWAATMVLCPVSVAIGEQRGWFPQLGGLSRDDGPLGRRARTRTPAAIPALVILMCGVGVWTALVPLPKYLSDPWEYDFSKLSSQSSRSSGAGHWSQVANGVFGTRGSAQLLLADSSDHVPLLEQRLRDADAQHGRPFISKIEVLADYLGGSPQDLAKKLKLVNKIRNHVDHLIPRLSGDDLKFAEQYRPPDGLTAPRLSELPSALLQRFTERDGRTGTQLYITWDPRLSQSQGKTLLSLDELLQQAKLPNGQVAPNAARASIFAEMIRSMSRDGPKAVLLALMVVALTCAMGLRSLANAGLVLLSLLCGVVWMMGIAALSGTRLNFLNFVALPLTFGIGAEYAINLVTRIRAEGNRVSSGVRSVGGSVVLCSLTTVIGYGSLLSADSQALAGFGRLAILGELCCLLSAFLVVPPLLQLATRFRIGRARDTATE